MTTRTLAELQSLPIFPFADEFPYISDEKILELAQDITVNGLRVPIVLFDGQILDGRNRLRALASTDLIAIPVWEFEGDALSALDYVASLNLHRRDLDATQRAFIGRAYKAFAADAAKTRQGTRTDLGNIQELIPGSAGQARDEAGAKAGVSGRYIDMAERVATLAPDLVEECRSGSLAITRALDIIKNRQGESEKKANQASVNTPDLHERFEKKIDRAVSNLSDAIADHAPYYQADDLRYVVQQLEGLIRQAERTFV